MLSLNPGLMTANEHRVDGCTASRNCGETLLAGFLSNILGFYHELLELVVLVQFMLICDVVVTVKHFLDLAHVVLRS
jgi:hypothetical protein